MGERGPKPIPSAIRKLQGKRQKNKREPQPEISIEVPEPPSYLDKMAKCVWQKLAPALHGLGLLTEIDENAFAQYCIYQGLIMYCSEKLKTEPLICTGKNGQPFQNPLVGIRNRASVNIRKLLAMFGLSPADRSRLEIVENEGTGEFINKFIAIP